MVKRKLKYYFVLFLIFILCLCFITTTQTTAVLTSGSADEGIYLPIIMYHSLLKDEKLQNDYTISPKLFEDDLKYLTDNGYTTLFLSDLIDYVYYDKKLPEKCIMLTFDDGYYNNYYYAYPLLKKYDCKAIISPIVSMTEQYTQSGEVSINFGNISVSDIKEMVASGYVEIQNHSYDMHRLTPRMGAEQKAGESLEEYTNFVKNDVTKAQDYLKENVGITPTCFIYPFGAKSESTPQIIKDLGFLCTMTCTEEPNYVTKNPESLEELGRYRRDSSETMQQLLERISKDK